MPVRERSEHYVNNKEFLAAIVEYRIKVRKAAQKENPDITDAELKNWSMVCMGGRYPANALSGAPKRPGTMYTTKLKVIMASTIRGTPILSRGLSLGNRIFPSR